MRKIWPYLLIGMLVCLPLTFLVLDISNVLEWSFGFVFIGLVVITKYIYDLRLVLQEKSGDLKQLQQEIIDVKTNSELLSQQKTEYLAKVSHDLRTPLHGINGVIEMIDKETISPKVQRYIEQMRHSSKSLMSVIANVIDLSGDGATDVVLKHAPFKVLDVCENVVRIFIQPASEKKVDIQLHFDPRLLDVWVHSDERRLQQVLTNLIGNAFKFTESGSVSLWVIERGNSDKNIEIRFMVVDTGIGIPEKELKSIFDPYYQVEAHQKLRIKGSGLGLNISQELITKFGGTLKVNSTEGIGSKFFFDISVKQTQSQNVNKLISNVSSYQNEVVLVTNKNTTTESLNQLFRNWGVDTIQCETAESVLEHEFHQKPTLMILELSIINDLEHAQAIKAHVRANNNYLLVDNFEQETFDNWQILNKPILPSDVIKLCVTNDVVRSITTTSSFDENIVEQTKLFCRNKAFKILIVDDVELNQIIMHELVKQLDIVDCDFASNGLDAVEMATSRHYDLILMDVHMPVMSGTEASVKISEICPESMIIALTATVDTEVNMILNGSVHSVLRKPLTLESFTLHFYNTFVKSIISKKELELARTQFSNNGLVDAQSEPFNILVSSSHIKIVDYLDVISHTFKDKFNIQFVSNSSDITHLLQFEPFHALVLDNEIEVQLTLKELERKRLIVPILLISETTSEKLILPNHITMINHHIGFNPLCEILCNKLVTAHHSNTQLSIHKNENIKL